MKINLDEFDAEMSRIVTELLEKNPDYTVEFMQVRNRDLIIMMEFITWAVSMIQHAEILTVPKDISSLTTE